MKKTPLFISAAVIALALSSCVEKSSKYQALLAQRDSLEVANQTMIHEFDSTLYAINEIETALQAVRETENMMVVQNFEGPNKNQAVAEIRAMQETIISNKARIAELEQKLQERGRSNAALKATIDRLKEQIQEKDDFIATLREDLEKKNVRIDELMNEMGDLNKNIEAMTALNVENLEIIKNQDATINTVWIAVATMDNLKEKGIITKKGIFSGKTLGDDFQMECFEKADRRELKQIPLNSKKVTLYTKHPESSYELAKDEEGMYTLNIIDADSFWKLSDYLVISIK